MNNKNGDTNEKSFFEEMAVKYLEEIRRDFDELSQSFNEFYKDADLDFDDDEDIAYEEYSNMYNNDFIEKTYSSVKSKEIYYDMIRDYSKITDNRGYIMRSEEKLDYEEETEQRYLIKQKYKFTDTDILSKDMDDFFDLAKWMYRGEFPLDEKWLLEFFEHLYNHEIFEVLSEDDYHGLCENKDFVVNLMEHTGAICEVASVASDNTIKEIFEDIDLLKKICNKEILKSSGYEGAKIISILFLRLKYCKDLIDNKESITNILDNIAEVFNDYDYTVDSECYLLITNTLADNCGNLFSDREFNEVILKFIEKSTENYDNISYPYMKNLAKKMLPTKEMASDIELAKRYVCDLRSMYNIDESLLKNVEFMELAIQMCDCAYISDFELPKELYKNKDILDKYISAKSEFSGIDGIYFDFNNPLFMEIYQKYFDENPKYVMVDEIRKVIEKNKQIVIPDDKNDYSSVISTIQQWAEDEDLIKIGEKLKIVKSQNGEIIEGQLNIGNQENTISIPNICNKTVVLDINNVEDTLKQLAIDTFIDMDEIQKSYQELINILREEQNNRSLTPEDVKKNIKGSKFFYEEGKDIRLKVNNESGEVKAVVTIPHPIYIDTDYMKTVELDGKELKEIIDQAYDNYLNDFEKIINLAERRHKLKGKKLQAKELLKEYEKLNKNKSLLDE